MFFFLPCPFSVLSPCHCSLSPVAGEAFGFELHAEAGCFLWMFYGGVIAVSAATFDLVMHVSFCESSASSRQKRDLLAKHFMSCTNLLRSNKLTFVSTDIGVQKSPSRPYFSIRH